LTEISYCVDDAGEDVKVLVEATEEEHGHSEGATEEHAGSEKNCHFHAGVE
jgi:zinc transporter 1/2/3